MGSLSAEPLATLVRHLKRKFNLQYFVETGTHYGAGTRFAAGVFNNVITIELNDLYRNAAMAAFNEDRVQYILGDSGKIMPSIVSQLKEPSFFWLDGHSGGGNFGECDYCPLLFELTAIADSVHRHFVFIDDARGFLAPPPPPFDYLKWPKIVEVLKAITKNYEYYCVVIDDIIICVPHEAIGDVVDYCNKVRPNI